MKTMMIADDNQQISSVLKEYAKKEGFDVVVAKDGEEAVRSFASHEIDIILLDVMMPKKDGFEVCREIRRSSNVPIIMVTARGEDFERIMGLDIGADDYIVKPFSPGEVMARVRAVLRRIGGESKHEGLGQVFHLADLMIDLDTYSVRIGDQPISLTKKEIELLWLLANHQNRVFTRDNLLDSIWGFDYYGDTRTVDSHIKRLRAKLEAVPHPGWEIRTVWGVGYKLEVLTHEK